MSITALAWAIWASGAVILAAWLYYEYLFPMFDGDGPLRIVHSIMIAAACVLIAMPWPLVFAALVVGAILALLGRLLAK